MGCCWRRLLVRLVVGVQRNHSDRGCWVTFGRWIKVCELEPTPMCVRWYLLLCFMLFACVISEVYSLG